MLKRTGKLLVRYVAVSVCAVFLFSALGVSDAKAETKTYRITAYLSKMHIIPIGFAKVPAPGVFERRGLAHFEDGTTAGYLMRGWGTFTPKGIDAEGYSQLTFADGATAVVHWEAKVATMEGKPGAVNGTGKYVSGTGRLEGIQGGVTFTGSIMTPYDMEKGTRGEAFFDVTANYTLPNK